MEPIIFLFLAGACGAFVKICLTDNKLVLPSISAGSLDLGFLGAIIIGGFTGYAIDGSYLTAAMGGFTGSSVIAGLVSTKQGGKNTQTESIEQTIRRIAKEEVVDPDLAVRVARAESSLNPLATNINAPDSIDRGIFQINSKFHPEVSEAQARDVAFATRFFCTAFKNGNLSWWNASKKNWDLTK